MGEPNEIPFDSPARVGQSGEPDYSDPPFKLDGLSEEVILKRLMFQIEFYFSNGNLWHDEIMRNVCNLNPDRWVPIAFFCTLKRIQEITTDPAMIVQALKQSTELELDQSCTTVRRRVPLPPFNPKRDAKRCVYADTLPAGSTAISLKKLFSRFGRVVRITPCLSLACNQEGPPTGPSPLLPGVQPKLDEVLDAILIEFSDKYAAKQATVSIASHNSAYRDWKHRGLSSNANTPSTARKPIRTPQSARFAPTNQVEASPLSLAPSSVPLSAMGGSRFSLTDFRLTPTVDAPLDDAPRVMRSKLSAASPEFLPKSEPTELPRSTKPLSEIVKSFAPFSPKEPEVPIEQVEKLDDTFNGIFVLSKYAYLSRLERLGEFVFPETPVPSSMATPASGPIMTELAALARERSLPELGERIPPSRSFSAKSPHAKAASSPHVKGMPSPHIKSSMSPYFKAISPLPAAGSSTVSITSSLPSPIVVPRVPVGIPPLTVLPISPTTSTSISEEGESPSKGDAKDNSPTKLIAQTEKKTPKITGLPPRSSSTNWRSPNLVAASPGSLGSAPSPSIKALSNPRASPTGPRGINPSPVLKAAESPRLDAEKKNPPSNTKPPKSSRRGRENSFEFSLMGSPTTTALSDNPNVTVHLPASPSLSAMALMKSITPLTATGAEPKQKTPVLRPRKSSQVEASSPAENGGRTSESPVNPQRRLSLQKRSSTGLAPTLSRYAAGPQEESVGFAGRGRGKPVQ